ncbi:hypothetical protein EPA93_33870 [Ktedonosporobacter rubrisoli]|uniref:Uncharacterized protein n=1 Tax=Ktedonosporobacter rubrisoli TaxID=2509675 RepID=A0A4P6JYR3_KTERU|nr:hypothetical protein [Ktedonosporobacter rubrisoli]QBD80695.1 hypothetical protein EPA93_33870 [Ktedonosporobacter rubrisoli]
MDNETNTLRQHIVLGVITLILAIAILALLFIPRQPQIYRYQGSLSGYQWQMPASAERVALQSRALFMAA